MNIIKFDFNEMVTLQGNQVRTTSLIINLTYISPMFPVHTGIFLLCKILLIFVKKFQVMPTFQYKNIKN